MKVLIVIDMQNDFVTGSLANPAAQAIVPKIAKKIKEYQKEGWKIFGSTNSVDVALLEHYNELFEKGDKVYELAGIASKFKSKKEYKIVWFTVALSFIFIIWWWIGNTSLS